MIQPRELIEMLKDPNALDDETRREVLEALLAPRRPHRMTYEEFLAWADEDTLAEWVNGKVIMTSPASSLHQRITLFLAKVIGPYADRMSLGAVLIAPFQMRLAQSAREPDLLFVANEHLDRLKDTHLDGPADLVIEVVSAESAGRDRGDKFYEYERAGIPEYWLLDPTTRRAEFYQLGAEGQYGLVAPDAGGVYRARQLPGLWLRVAWLWQSPLPSVEDVLLDVGGEAYVRQQLERFRRRGLLPPGQ